MAVKRWLRLFSSRWWILGLVVVVGAAGGMAYARVRNQDIRPLFEARATVVVGAVDSDRAKEELQADLEAAATLARQANATLIADGQGLVAVDQKTAEITFSSRSGIAAEAEVVAATMWVAYVEAASNKALGEAQNRIVEIIAEAGDILARLDALAPPETEPVPAVDPALSAQLDFLTSQVDALKQRSASLAVDGVLAELGDDRVGSPEEIDEELTLIGDRLDDLYAQIAELTLSGAVSSRGGIESAAPVNTQGSNQDFEPVEPDLLESTWSIEALQARFEDLQTEYGDLFLASQATDTTEEQVPVEVEDLTPDRSSIPLTAVLGAAAAALLAAAGIAVDDRIRRPIVVVADLWPLQASAEIPSRAGTVRRSAHRRARLLSGRTRGVRGLRNSAFEWDASSLGVPLVGLSGARVEHTEVQAVTYELAASLAAADRSVLILNLDFTPHPTYVTNLVEILGGGPRSLLRAVTAPTVADLLEKVRTDPEAGSLEIKKAFAGSIVLAPRVCMLLAGSINEHPTDVFLTATFRAFLDQAREQADVVLVVTPPLNDPATEVLRQRLDGVIAVCRVGRTHSSDLGLSGKGRDFGNLIAGVILTRWRRTTPLWRRSTAKMAGLWSRLGTRRDRLQTKRNHAIAELSEIPEANSEPSAPVLDLDLLEAVDQSGLGVESPLLPEHSEVASRRSRRG